MSALLLGSMSTLSDTSELQRAAFNEAFRTHGLDWQWDRATYQGLLRNSGGGDRIADHAANLGQQVDAAAVHDTKSELFQAQLAKGNLPLRPGVVDTIRQARDAGLRVALVTTTSPRNVAALLDGLGPALRRADFDLVLDASDVQEGKPDPESYQLAMRRLGESPASCVAVEDNAPGLAAAVAAGISSIAFPNGNTADHEFAGAHRHVTRLDLSDVMAAFDR